MTTGAEDIMSSRFTAVYERMRNQPRLAEVRRIALPSHEEFFDSIAPDGYPVVFSNTKLTPLDAEIILRNLRTQFGTLTIDVRIGDYDKPAAYARRREYRKMPLSEYIESFDKHSSDIPPYAGNQPISAAISEGIGIQPPSFFALNEYEKVSLWLGPAGAVTPLHKDSSENFAFHVFGAKRWVLFPPRDAPFLYLSRTLAHEGSDFAPSAVDVRDPDISSFPLFTSAVACEVVVKAGETLYLPTGWSHYVENVEATLMVNYWLHRLNSTPAVLLGQQIEQ